MKRIVIAGGGVAAFESASAARKTDANAEITIYTNECVLPYRRPALSALAANNEEPGGTFFIKDADFYSANKISVKTGQAVNKILPHEHNIVLSDESVVPYDKLIIATGASARRIPVAGADGDNCFVLRDYRDLLAIRSFLGERKLKCAVIGGGLLGLELADSLLKRGCHVTVIEGAPRLLPRNLDEKASEFVLKKISGVENLEVLLDKKVVELTSESVILADCVVECDFIAFSAGAAAVIPECDGLWKNRGIVVDKNMQTNLPDVFAAGDCAEFEGLSCGLYTTASAMGKVAGTCAAGGDSEYVPAIYPARFNALGVKMFSAGVPDENIQNDLQTDGENYSRVFYGADGNISAVILLGDVSAGMKYLKQMSV